MGILSQFTTRTLPVLIALIKRLDPACWDLLKPHANKVICFNIDHLPILYFQIAENDLILLEHAPNHIDTTFAGPMSTFISMLLNQHRTVQGLHVRGDIECAKALYDSWHHFDADWEGQLATFVGDNLAHGIAQGVHQSKTWLQETWQNRQEDLGAYLQDETQLLPTQGEVGSLFNRIDVLRHDVARFEAKLHLLAQRCKENQG